MQNDFFQKPDPPRHRTVHLWLGVLLSGLIVGLGTFYGQELHHAREAQIVLDIGPRPSAVAGNSQLNTLLADVKELMGALKQTQSALQEAQARIVALEQENKTLREAALTVASATPALSAATAALPPQGLPPVEASSASSAPAPAVPVQDGMGGPLVPIPVQIRRSGQGPRACWMRGDSMMSTYRITIRDNGFTLSPTWPAEGHGGWPDEFGATMANFRSRPIAPHAELSREEFQKAMRPYYYYGMKQDVHCRFLVTVSNATTTDEAWQAGLEMVERYFFKKIRGGRGEEVALKAEQ